MFWGSLSASVGTYLQPTWRRIPGNSNFQATRLTVIFESIFLTCLNTLARAVATGYLGGAKPTSCHGHRILAPQRTLGLEEQAWLNDMFVRQACSPAKGLQVLTFVRYLQAKLVVTYKELRAADNPILKAHGRVGNEEIPNLL